MKKLTLSWLIKNNACNSGVEYYKTIGSTELAICLRHAAENNQYSNAIWVIKRKFSHKELIAFSIFCAEQVIENYEKEYPDDKRPRQAIEAAKAVLKKNTEQNRSAESAARSAESAARSARSAWYAARSAWYAARSAAWSAAWSAESAARSAESAAWSAEYAAWSAAESAEYAAWYAARSAAWSAAESAEYAENEMKKIILLYAAEIAEKGYKNA